MRSIVLQVMTTLNGRIDDPGPWVTSVSDDQYAEIDRLYAAYDTVLVGSTTYAEMVGYWPGAEHDPDNSDTVRSMAHRMNTYRKLVFTSDATPLTWHNSERVAAQSDADIVDFAQALKAQPGSDIILSGGARLAQTFVRLGLVDAYRFFVYPLVSMGETWYAQAGDIPALQLVSATAFTNGVVGLYYDRA
jgi:dihydrofolate reductase